MALPPVEDEASHIHPRWITLLDWVRISLDKCNFIF
jgi:hypothetical protein